LLARLFRYLYESTREMVSECRERGERNLVSTRRWTRHSVRAKQTATRMVLLLAVRSRQLHFITWFAVYLASVPCGVRRRNARRRFWMTELYVGVCLVGAHQLVVWFHWLRFIAISSFPRQEGRKEWNPSVSNKTLFIRFVVVNVRRANKGSFQFNLLSALLGDSEKLTVSGKAWVPITCKYKQISK